MSKIHKNIVIGNKYGRWTVLGVGESRFYSDKTKKTSIEHRMWLCLCECGTERVVSEMSLKSGKSVSCGCYNRERSSLKHTKHGEVVGDIKSVEYSVWSQLKARCNNPKNSRFAMYGGRGISVCERWNEFGNFLEDMGRRPGKSYSLDRIDNNKGYSPDNCKWSTPHEQMTNRTITRFVSMNGEKVPLATLAKQHNIPANTLRFRILKGWDIDEALNKPVRYKSPHH